MLEYSMASRSMSRITAVAVLGLVLMTTGVVRGDPPPAPLPPYELPGDGGSFPAVGSQTDPFIAPGGGGYLLVWTDDRSTVLEGTDAAGTDLDIYAARLTADGSVIDTVPIAVTQAPGDQYDPRAVWNGQNWLVIWTGTFPASPIDRHNTEGVRVSSTGEVLDQDPFEIWESGGGDEHVVGAASDGQDWAVVMTDVYVQGLGTKTRLVGIKITADGTVQLAPSYLFSPSCCYFFYHTGMAFADGVYMVVFEGYVSGSEYGIFGLRLRPNLTTLDSYPVELVQIPMQGETHFYRTPNLTSDGNGFFVDWQLWVSGVSSQVWGARVSADGQSLDGDGVAISDVLPVSLNLQPSATWDGIQWIAAWPEAGQTQLARIDVLGEVVDPGGVSTGLPDDLVFTGSGAGLQVAWEENRYGGLQPYDVFTAGMSTDLVLGTDACASLGAPAQMQADMAHGDRSALAVYTSAVAGETRVMAHLLDFYGAAVTTEPVQLATGAAAHPRVAFDGEQYLVVWDDLDPSLVRGVRVDEDGTVLDASPLDLLSGLRPDVAGRDGGFLVVATDATGVHGVRIASDGTIIDTTPLLLGAGIASYSRAATLGSYWIVVWESHEAPDGAEIYYSFILQSGVVAGPVEVTPPGDGIAAHRPAIAAAAESALIVWQDSRGSDIDIYGRRISSSLIFSDPATGLAITTAVGDQTSPAVAWDGERFVLDFADTRDRVSSIDHRLAVYRNWVASTGPVAEPAGLPLYADGATVGHPTVTGNSDIQIYAASVFRAEAPHGSYRLQVSDARSPTAVEEMPTATRPIGTYPNPFNPQTTITFALDRTQRAEIAVYDLTGKQIAVLADRAFDAGNHSVVWQGKDAMGREVSSGTYVVRLVADFGVEASKVMLIR